MKSEKKIEAGTGLVLAIVGIVLLARIISIPMLGARANFAPMDAIALFGGTYLASPIVALLLPLLAVFVSDQIINAVFYSGLTGGSMFYEGSYWTYASYVLISAMGLLLRERVRPGTVFGASIAASTVFFLISNFGVWFSTPFYSHDLSGLMMCFTMAIPFFGATLLGDLFYSALMFGSCELASSRKLVPVHA